MLVSLLKFAPIGLLPVLVFLSTLYSLDSYRLVKLRMVLAAIAAGGGVAILSYLCNGFLMPALGMSLVEYSRWVAPAVEETGKALVMVYLLRSHRVGFLIDAAILGFAIGAGFALIENFYYLYLASDTALVVWIVRGFGTAIMHGGVVAIFAVMSKTMSDESLRLGLLHCLPGLLVAIAIHSVFNHFYVSPVMSTIGTLLVLPPILYLVLRISERRVHKWLEADFDEDWDLVRLIDSGKFDHTHAGTMLAGLREQLDGPVVADMLCYLKLYTELALRAKGVLLMRENGLDVPMDDETRGKFAELRYLQENIGVAGCMALRPFLHMTGKDLWQLQVLGD